MKELLTRLDSQTVREAEGFHRINPDYKIIDDISSELSSTVFGQDKAMRQLAGAVARSMAGFSDPHRPEMVAMFLGPTGVGKCLHAKTPIYDPVDKTTKTVKERYKEGKSFHVYALNKANNIIITEAQAPEKFTQQKMYRTTFEDGSYVDTTRGHRFFSGNSYNELSTLQQRLLLGEQVRLPSISAHALSKLPVNVQSSEQKVLNSPNDYHLLRHLYGLLPQWAKDICRAFSPLANDVYEPYFGYFGRGDWENKPKHNRHYQGLLRLSMLDFSRLVNSMLLSLHQFRFQLGIFVQFLLYPQFAFQLMTYSNPDYIGKEPVQSSRFSIFYSDLLAYIHGITGIGQSQVKSIKAMGKSYYYDFEVPQYNNYWACGVFNHNTESAKALAKHLYRKDADDHFLRIDCTQLMESHSVGRLKGSEPSYVGYGDNNILITQDFLQRGGVIVFDEIEKAHPNVLRWLLPVLEEGQQKALVPAQGSTKYSSELTTLDFSKTYIVMTANVGAEALHRARAGQQGIGFHSETSKPDMDKIGLSELKKAFKDMPEFLGRIDSTVVFEDLGRPEFEKIFNKFMDEINQDQRYGHNFLVATSEVRDFIIDHAETGEYGAREIRHQIDQRIVNGASEIKFSGVLADGAPLIAYDIEDGKIAFGTIDLPHTPEIHDDTPEDYEPIDEDKPIQSQRDPGSYIGNAPEPINVRRKKKEDKPTSLEFFMPVDAVTDTIDLSILVHADGKQYAQVIEGIPLLKPKR